MTEPLHDRQEWIRGRRKKRKSARLARIRRQLIRYTLLAGLVTLGVAGFTRVDWWLQTRPEAIEVRNNKVASTEQIRAVLAPYIDRPLFRLDPQRLESQVNKLPAVKYSFVRRSLLPKPHLVVEVLEEFPWATLCTAPGVPPHAVIAQSGRIIPIKDFPAVIQPHLQFYGDESSHLKEADVVRWANWIALTSAQTGCAVTCVDMRNPADIKVQSGDLKLKVGPADSGLARRLGRLNSVMPVLSEYRARLEYIDLSLDNSVPLKVAKEPIKGPQDAFKPGVVDTLDVTESQNLGEPSSQEIRVRKPSPLDPDSQLQLDEEPLDSPSQQAGCPLDGSQTADSRPAPEPPI
jgi:cell division septal protein FtsQ